MPEKRKLTDAELATFNPGPRRRYLNSVEVRKLEVPAGAEEIFEFPISSENPIEDWFGLEILDHSPGCVRLDRLKARAAYLDCHDRRAFLGAILDGEVRDDRRVWVQQQYSRNEEGQKVKRDWIDGLRPNVSFGYRVYRYELTRGEANAPDIYRAVDWEIYEVSNETIPADITVGKDRAAGESATPVSVTIMNPAPAKERTMSNTIPETPPATAAAGGEPGSLDRILQMAERHKAPFERVRGWIEKKLSPEQVAMELLESTRTALMEPQPASELLDGLKEKDRKRYSYQRFFRNLLLESMGDGRLDGVEAEVDQGLAKIMPRRNGGRMLPLSLSSRTMGTTVPGYGAEWVTDGPPQIIELLKVRSVALALGSTHLTGVVQNIPFIGPSSRPTVYFKGENPATPATGTAVGSRSVDAVLKMMLGLIEIPRQLLMQPTIDSESMIRDLFADGHALCWDRNAFHGIGGDGAPLGLFNWTGVTAVDFSSGGNPANPTRLNCLKMAGNVADAGGLLGNLGWAINALMAATMAGTAEASNTADWLFKGPLDDGTVVGYKAIAGSSSQLYHNLGSSGIDGAMAFGNWKDLVLLDSGVVEVLVDEKSKMEYGNVRFGTFQLGDSIVRDPQSFNIAEKAKVA